MEVPEVVKAAETLVAFVEALEAAEVVKAAETLEVFVEALEAAEVVKAAEAFEALEADPGSPIDLENFVELGVHFLSDLGLAYLFAVAELVP